MALTRLHAPEVDAVFDESNRGHDGGGVGGTSGPVASPTAHTFEREGCAIHWWESGPRHGPCLVLTHGVTINHGTYASQVPLLAQAGYRVVTWDLRGHGRSRPAAQPMTFERSVDDLEGLVEETGAVRAVLVGQSFGGMIVQAYQRRRPERVAGIVLAGSLPYGVRVLWPLSAVYGKVAPSLQRIWPERHLRRLVPPFMSKRDDVRRYVAEAIEPLGRDDFATCTKTASEALVQRDPLGAPNTPTLCVIGSEEIPLVARAMRSWAGRSAHARVVGIERAGHLVNQEEPAAFCDAVLAFLDTVDPWENDRSS